VLDTPAHAAFSPGSVIGGKYRVERQLAEGGIGVVVLARHLQLGHQVAIKYLQAKVLTNSLLVTRFMREAQLAASIHSDHVVRVFDVGTLDDGGPYMVMEFLDGEDLGAVVARGPLAQQDAIDYVMQACDAIAEAHGLGIVHRDIKPENLFLARRGSGTPIIKIVDFGISKSTMNRDTGKRLPRMTEDGDRFGTPMYMSPEQLASSTNVDARADIWALGVVLFELLTARIPFDGESVPQIAASILTAPAKLLRTYCPGASSELEAAVSKCLEKTPDLRFRNVAELAQELAPFGSPVSQRGVFDIQRIVRDSGASIRPPRPSSPEWQVGPAAPSAVRPLAETLDAISGTRSAISRPSKTALVGVLGACALIAGSVIALGRARVDRPVTLGPPPFGVVETPPPAPPQPLATASTGPAAQPTVSARLAEPVAPSAAKRSVEVKLPRQVVAIPAPPTKAPSTGFQTNVDYKEFGERR
jgi:serine/threonine protein kinase